MVTNVENQKIVVNIDTLTKELSLNSKMLKLISKKRLEFDEKGKKVPNGKRYVMLLNVRERKIIFDVIEIKDLLKMINDGKGFNNFDFAVSDDGIVTLNYKRNSITFPQSELNWLIASLMELDETIQRVDSIIEE